MVSGDAWVSGDAGLIVTRVVLKYELTFQFNQITLGLIVTRVVLKFLENYIPRGMIGGLIVTRVVLK